MDTVLNMTDLEQQPVLPIEPLDHSAPSWWGSHWVPASCGVGILTCSIASVFFPPLLPICGTLVAVLTATGFLTSAQSTVVNSISKQVVDATKKSVEISKQMNFVSEENVRLIKQVNQNTADISSKKPLPLDVQVKGKILPMLCILGFAAVAMACSAKSIANADAVLVRIEADAKTVLITGCKDLPAVRVGVLWLESVVPKTSVVYGGIVALDAVDPLAQRLCAVVRGLPEAEAVK